MIKNILIILISVFGFSFSEVTHSGLTGTNIHTVYRWQFADSAARVNQSIAAADTMKLAYQRSDSTSWILLSTTGTKWKKISFASNQNTLTTSNVQFNNVKSVRDSTSDAIVSDSLKSVTGTFSGVVAVDSLKSTKGINATGGTFSGTIATKDINITDLTSGYIPYKSTNLENSNIFTNGTNTSVGKSSVEAWNSGYRALQIGGTSAIMASNPEVNTGNVFYLSNCYNDGTSFKALAGNGDGYAAVYRQFKGLHSWYSNKDLTADDDFTTALKMELDTNGVLSPSGGISTTTGTFSGALTSTTLNTGNGANELYAMDHNVRTTDAVTFATVNTGNGDNELYPMNQAVTTTSDVAFDSTRTRVNVVDSIKLGSGSYLKTYVEGSFPCTLKTSDVTVQQIETAYYTKIGNVITISFPVIAGTSNSGTFRVYCKIPYKPKQEYDGYNYFMEPAVLTDNGSKVSGYLVYYEYIPNYLDLKLYSGSFTTSGIKGLNPFSVSYITE